MSASLYPHPETPLGIRCTAIRLWGGLLIAEFVYGTLVRAGLSGNLAANVSTSLVGVVSYRPEIRFL